MPAWPLFKTLFLATWTSPQIFCLLLCMYLQLWRSSRQTCISVHLHTRKGQETKIQLKMSCYKRCSQTARIYQAIHFFHRHLHRTHFWSCNCQQQQNISDVLTTPLPNKNTVPLTKWSAIFTHDNTILKQWVQLPLQEYHFLKTTYQFKSQYVDC